MPEKQGCSALDAAPRGLSQFGNVCLLKHLYLDTVREGRTIPRVDRRQRTLERFGNHK